jgi:hypothetical protein
MDATIMKLETTAADDTVGFTFVEADYWKDWMRNWTLAVADVDTHGPVLDEWGDSVVRWGGEAGMWVQNPMIFAYWLGETTSDELWLRSRISRLQLQTL